MEAVKRTKTVSIEYWDCGDSEHTHRTERVANDCIQKRANAKPPVSKDERTLRKIHMALAAMECKTLKEAGKRFGVSPSRVQSCIGQAMRMSMHPVYNLPDIDRRSCFGSTTELRARPNIWKHRLNSMIEHIESKPSATRSSQ